MKPNCYCGSNVPCGFYVWNHSSTTVVKGQTFAQWFKDTYVSCKFYLEWGKSWSLLAGDESSQTQYAAQDDDGNQVWNHPIDAHFATASMQGWPRIVVQGKHKLREMFHVVLFFSEMFRKPANKF